MSIITLTSDWGYRDHYLGAVKGAIHSKIPGADIIDISHSIPSYDILQCSFVIKNAYRSFPGGTIHVIGMKTEASIESPHTLVYHNKQYFIGSDNGIFSLIFNEKPEKIVELNIMQESNFFTFSTRDVFVPAAARIANGEDIDDLGAPKENLYHRMNFEPVKSSSVIKGNIIYIDNYENAITNITQEIFKEVGKGRRFSIFLPSPGYDIEKINVSYSDVLDGEKLALFGSTHHLEIAINQGNAASLLGLEMYDPVRIEFYD
jgi:hypothetical protein